MSSILLTDAAAGGGYGSILMMVGYIAVPISVKMKTNYSSMALSVSQNTSIATT